MFEPTRPLRVAIDDGQVPPGGIRRLAGHLERGLRERGHDVRRVRFGWSLQADWAKPIKRVSYLLDLAARVGRLRGEVDLIHFANYYAPKPVAGLPFVVTICDLIPLIRPDFYPSAYVRYFERTVRHAVERADLLLTISTQTSDDLTERFPQAAGRVRCVYACIDDHLPQRARTEAFSRPVAAPYLLFIGKWDERKQIPWLVDQFLLAVERDALPPELAGLDLVLAGSPGLGFERVAERLRLSRAADRVRLMPHVSDQMLAALLQHAHALVLPSAYEGFGLTLLEAMGAGTPILSSDLPTTREICADAARLVPVGDAEALWAAAAELSRADVRGKMIAAGLARAPFFSIDAHAARHEAAYATLR